MGSRKIEDLVPELREKAEEFAQKMADAGVSFIFTCTRRSQEEQDELYARGRTKPGRKVTWTRKSKHIEGRAFDIAIVREEKAVWDIKADVNNDNRPDYIQAGELGESIGLRWGGRFKSPDYPHFEL